MKRSTTSSRRVRSGDRQPFARHSNQVRRRAVTFKLESLEERTLLSVGSSVKATSTQAILNSRNASVISESLGSIDTTVPRQSGPTLPSSLLQSIKDAGTVATVTANPTNPTTSTAGCSPFPPISTPGIPRRSTRSIRERRVQPLARSPLPVPGSPAWATPPRPPWRRWPRR